MSKLPVFSSLEGLEYWFNNQPNVKWRIYPGHSANRKSIHSIMSYEMADNKDDAWEELSKTLTYQSNPGSKVTIQTYEATNSKINQVFYEVPGQNGIAGIGNSNNILGVAGGIQAYISGQIQAAVSEVKHAQELKEKDQEIAALQADLDDKHNPTWKDKIGSSIAENPIDFMEKGFMMFGMAMEKFAKMQNPQIAMATPMKKTNTDNTEDQENTAAPTNQQEAPQYTEAEEEVILEAIDRISKHMNVAEVLPKIADKIENDPSIVNFLKSYLT